MLTIVMHTLEAPRQSSEMLPGAVPGDVAGASEGHREVILGRRVSRVHIGKKCRAHAIEEAGVLP